MKYEIKSFTIYDDYFDLLDNLPVKEKSAVIIAMLDYMFKNTEPTNLSGLSSAVFNNLKRPLDKSKQNSKRRTKATDEKNNNRNETEKKPNNNQNNNQTITHQDVNVIVNNNKLNINNLDNNYLDNNKLNNNNNNNIDLFSFIESNLGRTLSGIEYEEINTWEDNELTRYAIKKAVLNGKYHLSYVRSILNYYRKNKIKTIQQAQQDEEDFKSKHNKKTINKSFKEIEREKELEAEKMFLEKEE